MSLPLRALLLAVALAPSASADDAAPPPAPVPQVGQGKAVAAPPRVEPKALLDAIAKGGGYLLQNQRKDGSWTVKDDDSSAADNPYIRAAVTAVVVDSLTGPKVDKAAEAVTRGRRFIDENGRRPPAEVKTGFDGNTQRLWAIAMGLKEAARRPAGEERDNLVKGYFAALEEVRAQARGMNYYGHAHDMASFQAALLADGLQKVAAAGYALPKGALKEALDKVESARDEKSGGFGYYAAVKPDDEQDAACRSLACEAALDGDGRSDPKRLEEAVERMLRNRKAVEEAQANAKLVTHDPANHNIAKYYNLFSLRWAAKVLPRLPDEKAEGYAHAIGRIVLDSQRADGSWLDSANYSGPAYGTAYAMLALDDAARELAAIQDRKKPK